jgi:hypothetical protein
VTAEMETPKYVATSVGRPRSPSSHSVNVMRHSLGTTKPLRQVFPKPIMFSIHLMKDTERRAILTRLIETREARAKFQKKTGTRFLRQPGGRAGTGPHYGSTSTTSHRVGQAHPGTARGQTKGD